MTSIVGSMPASRRCRSAATDSRSASRRVDDGWLSPALTTTSDRSVEARHALTAVATGAVASTDGVGAFTRGCSGASGTLVRPADRELAAQDRDDELAEHLDLLQDDRQRQPGVVDQEQLALVVADDVAERERPVDDLLRRPDGDRRLGHVVLERRPAAVDRRLVEVRPELADGLLRVVAHVDLAAEPDDGLVGRPVAVVLEALAVERDHALDVLLRPEDVVVEEAVAVVGGLLGDLRAADGAVPDERRHAVERAAAWR